MSDVFLSGLAWWGSVLIILMGLIIITLAGLIALHT
jgi:hypothetical protein